MPIHRLGGAVVQNFGGKHQYDYHDIYPYWTFKGQILDAAFITREYRNKITHLIQNYTIPTLTLMGELDSRIARISEQFYIQLVKGKTNINQPFVDNQTLSNYPIILINGMNHMDWATGQIPPEVLEQDLMSEINTSYAQNIASDYMSCWMSLQLDNGRCDFDTIYNGVYDSQTLVNPFIDAFILEGSYWIINPCNCEPQICQSTSYCQAGSPWLDDVIYPKPKGFRVAQDIMCDFDEGFNVSIGNTDSFHSFATSFIHPHFPFVWNYCDRNEGCVLNTSTASQNAYYDDPSDFFADYVDTGGHSTSAVEMRHKMKSKQACYEHIGFNVSNMKEDFNICGKINEYTMKWAMNSAPKQTLQRYLEYGEYIEVADDVLSKTGSEWDEIDRLNETRKCNETTHKYYTSLTSYYIFTNTTSNGCKFDDACGSHYCKLLSPAHMMEWMYYQGLRFNLSISNLNKTVNITC